MHLRLGLAMALGALGRDGDALAQAARGLRQAEETGSTKYVGWFHLVQGELALGAGQPAAALTELGRGAIRSRMLPTRAQEVARRIGFPTLTWQSAHRLAEAQAAGGCLTDAASAAILAAETIERMAAEAPDARCRETLLAWPRVQATYETLEQLRRLA